MLRPFCDSNNDGIGDFVGLCSKLDYLKDLGVTVIWLLPFYPSPLRDDGYDIADYTDVHPDYGTLRDFKNFMRAAHDRGLRVITELVLNHTSDKHAWFQKARTSKPGSAARDFLRLERQFAPVRRSQDYFSGFRNVQLDLGPRLPGPISGIVSTRTSRT